MGDALFSRVSQCDQLYILHVHLNIEHSLAGLEFWDWPFCVCSESAKHAEEL